MIVPLRAPVLAIKTLKKILYSFISSTIFISVWLKVPMFQKRYYAEKNKYYVIHYKQRIISTFIIYISYVQIILFV